MLVYIIMTICCFILLYFSKKVSENKKKWILIALSFLTVFAVSALRVNVGTDYKSYVAWFKNISVPTYEHTNFLFNNLIVIIKIFTKNPQWLFIITSLIILIFVYLSIIREQENEYDMALYLFIALGFYFATMNGIRQWIAIALFMYAYKFVTKKSFWLYALVIVIASLFHISAITLLPFYFIFNFKINDKWKLLIVAIFAFAFNFINFNYLLEKFFYILAPSFYGRYISSGVDLSKNTGSPLPILLCGGMLFYYIIFDKKFEKNMDVKLYERHKYLCFIILLFAIINTVNNIFSRYAAYFIPMVTFILPDFYLIYTGKWRKLIKISILIVGILFLVINTLLKNSNSPLPYISIFNN